mgnify:CR=1 FL=1
MDPLDELREFAEAIRPPDSELVALMDVARIVGLSESRRLGRLARLSGIVLERLVLRSGNGGNVAYGVSKEYAKKLIELYYQDRR